MITPLDFATRYLIAINRAGTWTAYQDAKTWTGIATKAAESACRGMGLKTRREYMRLDLIGYDKSPQGRHDWHLRVAFEVETGADWKDEFCKLSHVVADLCVLAGYEWHAGWTARGALEDYLKTHRRRALRVPGRRWLFIFGPHWQDRRGDWTTWTLGKAGQVVPLAKSPQLRGTDLRD